LSIEYKLGMVFFVFGSMIGSFLNVLIYRIPLGENFVSERSKCTSCGKLIYWYENIPLLSYLFLRGKCSKCGERISIRYPLVELVAGVMSVYLMPKYISGENIVFYLFHFSIFCALLVHFLIDVKHKILPDGINLYLAIFFFLYAVLNYNYQYWLIGGLIGFLFPLGVTYLFYLLKNKVGLGGGDIKLYGALGLYLGPIGVLYNIFFSCLLGSVIALPLMIFKIISRNTAIPFGPFIIVVAFLQIYFPKFFNSILSLLHLKIH
jgi:leader peptidase (prepilin peptidase)/N-methyltransferase